MQHSFRLVAHEVSEKQRVPLDIFWKDVKWTKSWETLLYALHRWAGEPNVRPLRTFYMVRIFG